MNQNIIDVINSLGESDELLSIGEMEYSKIVQASEKIGVEFAKDFVEYTHNFGAISVGGMEICGIIDDAPYLSTVDRTLEMRGLFSDFPMDCYVIESVGIDNAVMVQKSDGKIYQFLHGHNLMLAADSLSEYLLNGGDFRKERVEYWKARSND